MNRLTAKLLDIFIKAPLVINLHYNINRNRLTVGLLNIFIKILFAINLYYNSNKEKVSKDGINIAASNVAIYFRRDEAIYKIKKRSSYKYKETGNRKRVKSV